jgi:membrane-bound ClpP family serine protease
MAAELQPRNLQELTLIPTSQNPLMAPYSSEQAAMLALNDALIAIHATQQELSQSHEKLKIAFDRVVRENVEIRQDNVLLRGIIETQDKVHSEQVRALSGQIDAIQKLTLEQAKQLIKDSEEKMDKKAEQFRGEVKTAYNTHAHNYWRALSTPSDLFGTSQPNKLL